MSFAVDANILLYASDSSGPHHKQARSFLESCMSGEETFYLGWPTLMGYLRMATHPAIFERPLSPSEAMRNVDALLGLPHVRALFEQEGFWEIYRGIAKTIPARGNMVPDIHLAALLRHHGIKRLYTHDRDFRKFDFLRVVDPIAA